MKYSNSYYFFNSFYFVVVEFVFPFLLFCVIKHAEQIHIVFMDTFILYDVIDDDDDANDVHDLAYYYYFGVDYLNYCHHQMNLFYYHGAIKIPIHRLIVVMYIELMNTDYHLDHEDSKI